MLGWTIGAPRAGALAAWLLALHPWHTRYLSEARGYSIAMALVSGTLIAMIAALQRGSWARWSAYGGLQLLLLWTYPGAVYHVLFMNLVALGAIVAFDRGREALRSQLVRFFFVNLAGALFWVLMMTPNLFQLASYLGEGGGDAGNWNRAWRWLVEYGSHLAAGMHWEHGEDAQSFHVAFGQLAPLWRGAWLALGGVALLGGVLRLAAAGGVRAALLPIFLLASPLFVAQSLFRGDLLYPWYAIFFLPPAALLVGLGVDGIASRIRNGWAVPIAGVVLLGTMLAVAWPMHRLQTDRPIYPDRDAVAFTRPLETLDAEAHTAIRTVTWSDIPSGYDPWIVRVRDPDALREEMRSADAQSTRSS